MNGELSHGLAALVTSGNQILQADRGTPVLLRGLNRSGLEYAEPNAQGFLAAAQMTQDEMRAIVTDWRANVIRIPFNQDWCLRGRGAQSAEGYLASLDQVISWAAELSAYTILDLQWLDVETAYGTTQDPVQGRSTNHIPPAPNEKTVDLWDTLAARYQSEPAVLFDLLGEPHSVLRDDPHPLQLVGPDGEVTDADGMRLSPQDWSRWASLLVDRIRRIKPDGLILVSGIDWGFDLSGVAVDAPNIVYSTHIYSNRNSFTWRKALGRCREVPIFVGEWGGTDRDLDFGRSLAGRMRDLGLGWTAWSWSDFPRLVASAQNQNLEPTLFGHLVRDELALNLR